MKYENIANNDYRPINILDYVFKYTKNIFKKTWNSNTFKSQKFEKEFNIYYNIDNYFNFKILFFFFLLQLYYIFRFIDVLSNENFEHLFFMPVIGIISTIIWYFFSRKRYKKRYKILNFINIIVFIISSCFFIYLKLVEYNKEIEEGNYSVIFNRFPRNFKTDFFMILIITNYAILFIFQQSNYFAITSLSFIFIFFIYINQVMGKKVFKYILNFQGFYNELTVSYKNLTQYEDIKNDFNFTKILMTISKFHLSEQIQENLYIEETLFFLLINFFSILLKNFFTRDERLRFLNYFKFLRYFNNGKDHSLDRHEYQLSIIGVFETDQQKIFVNENLYNKLQIIKSLFFKSENNKILTNQNLENKILTGNIGNNSIHNGIENDNSNINFVYEMINGNLISNKNKIVENNKFLKDIDNTNSEYEKNLNFFLEKIEVVSIAPLFSEFIKENKITNFKEFFDYLKNLKKKFLKYKSYIDTNTEKKEKMNKKKPGPRVKYTVIGNENSLLCEEFKYLGKFYLNFPHTERIFFQVKLRFIEDLDIIDVIISHLQNQPNNPDLSLSLIPDNSQLQIVKNSDWNGEINNNLNNEINQDKNIMSSDSLIKSMDQDFANRLKFFAKITHEFKTPINSIIGLINKIKSSNKNITNNNLQGKTNVNQLIFENDLNLILNLSNYSIYLINDVIHYSQIKAKINSVKFNIESINLREIMDFCYNIAKSLINCNQQKCSSIKINLDFNQEIQNYIIRSDEIRLKQIILNLISNSVKFTKRGNIILKANIQDDKKSVIVSVIDTGLGIREGDIEKLFNDNVILNDGTKLNSMGTGLGLSIIKNFCDKLGIKISLESKIYVGSSFHLTIPCTVPTRNFSDNDSNIISVRLHSGNEQKSYSKFFKAPLWQIKKSSSLANSNIKMIIEEKLKEIDFKLYNDKNTIMIDDSVKNKMLHEIIKKNSNWREALNLHFLKSISNEKEISEIHTDGLKISSIQEGNSSPKNYKLINNNYSSEANFIDFSNLNSNANNKNYSLNIINNNNEINANTLVISNAQYHPGSFVSQDKATINHDTFNMNLNLDNLDLSLVKKMTPTLMNDIAETIINPNTPKINLIGVGCEENLNEIIPSLSKFANREGLNRKIQSNNSVQNFYSINTNYCYLCNKMNFIDDSGNQKFPKVLIVDDNQFIRESFKKIINDLQEEKQFKIKVIEGDDGVDILNHIIHNQSNGLLKCVFTDENMEYLNGSEATRIIRNMERLNKISRNILISATSYEDQHSKDIIMNSGTDFIISKPYSKNQIYTTLVKFNII